MIVSLPLFVIISSLQVIEPVIIHTPEMELEFTARSPDQMSSFYEARGFPENILDVLKKQCYITAGITNLSSKKIWLDLSQWEFYAGGKPLKREHRDYWKKRWQDMGAPLNIQSTFRWTLIPETLDYLPGEREGGNIVLPFTNKPISLKAIFYTGPNKRGKKITIITDKLLCAEDAQ